MKSRSIAALIAVLAPVMAVSGEQKLAISPTRMTVGTHQTVSFVFAVGGQEIQPGGGVRIEVPVGNLETEPYFWDRPQIDMPDARGFVRASTAGGTPLTIKLYGRRGGIIECIPETKPILPGEKIRIVWAGIVQSVAWKLRIRAESRMSAESDWVSVREIPDIRFLPQKAVTLTATVPADAKRGTPIDLAVVLLDKFGNRASRYRGTVSLTGTAPLLRLPAAYTFTAADSGVHVFRGLSYQASGFHRISGTDGALSGHSNYTAVSDTMPALLRLFGDTHFHTGTGTNHVRTNGRGGDHRGNFSTAGHAYRYLRDVMRLDFASSSEHDIPELDARAWRKSQSVSNEFYDPGSFTTFFAYEWTSPVGHHVVAYKDSGRAVISRHRHPSLDSLWGKLDAQGATALTIPHVTWQMPDHQIWHRINNRYRRIGELYSLWNNRWLLQPADDPQRFELDRDAVWSYQYAWANGHKIGVIGSSDNHTGQPGANNYTVYTAHSGGLAVAISTANNRDQLWDAFQHRRTYATTGTRIWLDFRADGHVMGEEYATRTPPEFTVAVAGTNTLRSVDLIKFDGAGYRTIHSLRPDTTLAQISVRDNAFSGDSFYYVRVTQVDERWRSPWAYGTSEMAWSSPIWVRFLR